ncbi:MAG: S-layer homology domain-containing protein, partial [Acidobacteriota bacterium]
ASGTFWAGTTGAGVFQTQDGGDHWQSATDGIAGFWTTSLVKDPNNDATLWTGNQWGSGGGVFRTTDSGQSWTLAATGLPRTRVNALAVSPAQPPVLYAGLDFQGGVYRSPDAGGNWSPTSPIPGTPFITGLVVPLLDPSKVYAETIADLFVSADDGGSWAPAGPSLHVVSALLPDTIDSGTFFGFVDYHVQKSTDGAATWNPLENGIAGALVVTLAQSPSDPQLLLAGAQGDAVNGFAAMYRSTDGGASWTPATGIDPAYLAFSIAFDPSDASRVYASTYPNTFNIAPPLHGAFRSLDAGITWEPYDNGLQTQPLENVGTSVLAISSDGVRLHVGTPGGVFELTRTPVAAPEISGVTPGSGSASGGTPITITGSGFDPAAVVTVGSSPAVGVQVVDEGQILATTPPGAPGVASLTVTNPDTQFATLRLAFLYDFSDVPPESPFHDAVVAMALRGVTAGCGNGNFCPDDGMTRAQAAVQIEKALFGADFLFPPPFDFLTDVDRCSGTAQYIYQFFFDGITAGCGVDVFCPNEPLTRAQVAVLLLRAEHGGSYQPPDATGTVFGDVPIDAFAASFIEQLYAEGITAGCGGGNYCPDSTVTRAQAEALIGLTLPSLP